MRDESLSTGRQEVLLAAMLEPSFYSYTCRPSEVTQIETHISHVYLAGDLVYKIKKPVRFSFLDYSTLKRRRYFLHEELRLNRRLAPSVYLAVLPISFENNRWQLGSYAHPAEYVLLMRRLPERRMLSFLLERGQVTSPMMRSVAEILALFHARAPTGGQISLNGWPKAIQKIWEENLSDIRPFVGKGLDRELFDALGRFGLSFIRNHKDLFQRRVAQGRIREVHGDLHCEHICFALEGIQIFDCVEFSRRLRCCDVASEVGCLLMDLVFHGARELAQEFLGSYLGLAGDEELRPLLPFYQCYRALVRGKVTALRSHSVGPEALRYFDLAYSCSWDEFKPFLIAVFGFTGSGKSTLAAELGRRLGASTVGSDATRKALARTSERQDKLPYEEGIYSPGMTERAYSKMSEEAERLISKGEAVILDGTFQRRTHREAILRLALRHQVPVAWIHCVSSEEVSRKRFEGRAAEGGSISDGRWEIYLKQREAFEPLEDLPAENYLALNTEAPPNVLGRKAEEFLRPVFLRRSVKR